MTPESAGPGTGAPPLNPLLVGGPDYPFVRLARRAAELAPPGLARIDFSMGDPREETPPFIREALRRAVPVVSSYPSVAGQPALRQAFAGWFRRRYGVALDPETQMLPANGTKEAVFLMAFAVVGGDGAERRLVVIPSPAYPVYEPAARFAGAEPLLVPLRREDGWRFAPERVPEEVWRRTALLWLNTPHNPTGSRMDRAELARVAELARRHGFWVIADEAYAELYFDGGPPPSMLECGLENVVALHTLSKRSAMTGYRSGMIAGDPRLIAALRRFRPNVGVATPDFVQTAAIAAWEDDAHAADQRARYGAKRALLLEHFTRRGWTVEASQATFYLWLRAPGGDDVAFVERLLRVGLVTLPGSFLGAAGAGYVRVALVPTLAECATAIERLESVRTEVER